MAVTKPTKQTQGKNSNTQKNTKAQRLIFPRPFQVAHLAAILAISKDKHPTWRIRPYRLISEEDYYQDLVLRADYVLRCAENQQWSVYAFEYFEHGSLYSLEQIGNKFKEVGWHSLQSKNSVDSFFDKSRRRIKAEILQTQKERFNLAVVKEYYTRNFQSEIDGQDLSPEEERKLLKEFWQEQHQDNLNFAKKESAWLDAYLPAKAEKEDGKRRPEIRYEAFEIFKHLEELRIRCRSLDFSEDVVRLQRDLDK